MALNRAIITGRFTRDIELRTTQNNKSVVSATLACNREYTTSDKPEADFIEIVAWEKTADFISKYFSKGQEICVEGRLRTQNYEDKNGVKRKVTDIVVDRAHFVGKKSDRPESAKAEQTPEELPF